MDRGEERTRQQTRRPTAPRAPMPGPLGADWMTSAYTEPAEARTEAAPRPAAAPEPATETLHLDELFDASSAEPEETLAIRVVPVRSEQIPTTAPTPLASPAPRSRLHLPSLDMPAIDITPTVDRLFAWLQHDDHGLIVASWVIGAILLLVVAANGH